MRRLFALALVLATAWTIRAAHAGPVAPAVLLAGGFALVAAALAGDLAEHVRLPRVSGYLLFGLATGPSVANIISGPMARELQLIDGVAVALIALIAGLELNFRRLKARLWAMIRLGLVIIATLYLSVAVVLYLAWPYLPIDPDAGGTMKLALVALMATVVTSFSPTVTIAVIAEERASGPLSELTMAVVVLGDLALVLLFGFAMQGVRSAVGTSAEVGLFVHLSWDVVGSLSFGALVGAALAIYLRAVGREIAIVLVVACVVLSELGTELHFEPVMAALAAGLIVENVAPMRGDALKEAVERSALPILIIFFAAAGASLQLGVLRATWPAAVGLALVRLAAIRAGAFAGCRVSGIDEPLRPLIWRGLVSQAGLTLGLTVIVASNYPDWGGAMQSVMVAMIALHEMVGPVLFRSALARAGELNRGGPPPAGAALPQA